MDNENEDRNYVIENSEKLISGIQASMPYRIAPLMDVPIMTDSSIASDPEAIPVLQQLLMTISAQHPASMLEVSGIATAIADDAPRFEGTENFMQSVKTAKAWISSEWKAVNRSYKLRCYQNSAILLGLLSPFLKHGYKLRQAIGRANFTGRADGHKVVGNRTTHSWIIAENAKGEERILDVGSKWYSGHVEADPSNGQILLMKDLSIRLGSRQTIHDVTEWLGALGCWTTGVSFGFNPIRGYVNVRELIDDVNEFSVDKSKTDDKGGSFYA